MWITRSAAATQLDTVPRIVHPSGTSVSDRDGIDLSVVTVTPGGLEPIRAVLSALRAQTARAGLEIVIVSPGGLDASEAGLDGFGAGRVLTIGPIESLGRAIAAGMRAAGGPVVAYAEEHSLPEPGWAEAIIERHRGPWVAVGWALQNSNPRTRTSWAHLITDFGPAVAPVGSGERPALPWHHTSYKRGELDAFGDELGGLVEGEGMLQELLRARGGRLYLEGAVASRHLNIATPRAHLASHLHGGRGYGWARARYADWSPARRAGYALAFPLIPLVRLRRLLPDIRRVQPRSGRRRGLLALIALGLLADAFGEALGYLLGDGASRRDRLPYELHRSRFAGARHRGDPPSQPEAELSSAT
jgi:hypothetical protein